MQDPQERRDDSPGVVHVHMVMEPYDPGPTKIVTAIREPHVPTPTKIVHIVREVPKP